MFCKGCIFYHPFREKRCSIAPRMRVEEVERCDLRLEAGPAALAMRTMEAEEREKYAAWLKTNGRDTEGR